MKFVRGIALPDTDTHFDAQINANPMVGGKGTYQLSKLNSSVAHVKTQGVALDIGAHVGLWSRVLCRTFKTVHAFEPVPNIIECFRYNLSGKDNVVLHPYALGEAAGFLSMDPVANNSGNGRVDDAGSLKVEVQTLDKQNIAQVDFIKIDVEGFEKFVVLGGEKMISEQRPVMIVEQKPGNAERYSIGRREAIDILERWGAKIAWERAGDYCLIWP